MDDNEIIEALDKGKNLATADLAAFDVKSSRDGGCVLHVRSYNRLAYTILAGRART